MDILRRHRRPFSRQFRRRRMIGMISRSLIHGSLPLMWVVRRRRQERQLLLLFLPIYARLEAPALIALGLVKKLWRTPQIRTTTAVARQGARLRQAGTIQH